jgi:hypothetical protein
MIKLFNKIIAILILLNVVSCGRYMSSPRIGFFNMSDDYVYEINGRWNGYYVNGYDKLSPGGTPSLSFNVKYPSHFFGPVHLQFRNAKGELITKDFAFTKDRLPNTRYHNFDNVYIFFTQNGMEILTDKEGRSKKHPQHLKEIENNLQRTAKFGREYDIACSKGSATSIYTIRELPLSQSECRAKMPIYRPENMARINQYRKLYDAYEAKKTEAAREYKEKKAKENI